LTVVAPKFCEPFFVYYSICLLAYFHARQYFGEAFDRSACNGFCDNCVDALVTVRENQDYTPAAQDALRLVQEMQQQSDQITQVQCVAAFWGSQTKDVKDRGHDKLQHFAKGQNMSRVQAERLFDYLLLDGALEAFVVRNGPKWSNSYVKVRRLPEL